MPLRLETVALSKALEYFLSAQQWLDARTPPLEAHLPALVDAVRVLLDGAVPVPSASPPPPPRQNLPAQSTLLVGREREIESVRDQLLRPDVRLLTLTGPGGIGKTRLALSAAGSLVDEFSDGVFFAALAPVADPQLVGSTIAHALGVKETGERSLQDSLQEFLADRALLLVLDNFEQVLGGAPLVATLMKAAPGLKVLATSRIPLRLYGEQELPVPPLTLPDLRRLPALEALAEMEAVRLFVGRAQAVKPDFQLDIANAAAVAEICVRLDGLPLAIELAAARVKLLPPQALLARLSSRLKLLTGGARDLPTRQQTLRGAIAWSYDLLDPAERQLFARLGVFSGGSTLEAIEAVANAAGDLELDVLDGVDSLVGKSLLRQDDAIEPRFAMLQTIREFALERLDEDPAVETVRAGHVAFFLALAEQAEPELRGPRQAAWLEQLEREHDNLRAALGREGGIIDSDIALRLAGALARFWLVHGHLTEGQRWLEAVLASGGSASVAARTKALHWAGTIARRRGEYARAGELLGQSLSLRREQGDTRGVALSLNSLGVLAMDQGDYATARDYYEQALALQRELGDRWSIAASLGNLAGVAMQQGAHREAEESFEESLALFRSVGDTLGTAGVLANLGILARGRADFPRALSFSSEALQHFADQGARAEIAGCLELVATILASQGLAEQAARIFGAAEALRQTIDAPVPPDERPAYERGVEAVRTALEDAVFAAAWAEGRGMEIQQAVAYALADA